MYFIESIPYKQMQHGYYHERHMAKLMQEDKGSQEQWDMHHKQALYWEHQGSLPAKYPEELRAKTHQLFKK